ncbi:MAG: GAF domain-containing protein [Solirubrobacterales bacterium]|nr:GAF domain-containing protein [Solirubrobacterales bacterium]
MIPMTASVAPVAGPVADLLADARRLLGPDAPPVPREMVEADLRSLLPLVTDAVLKRLEAGVDAQEERVLLSLGVRTQDVLDDLHRRASAHRVGLRGKVHAGLTRLRRITASADLLDKVCEEAVHSCGVRRVVLSRVEGSTWYPWMARFGDDREAETEFVRHIRGITIDLADAPIEAAVIRDGRPRIVADATGPSGYGPMLKESQGTSYVVAPITPAGRVVGFLHADHHPDATAVDLVDRDVLWAFAEGFGRIYERVELHERLAAQRHRVRETFALVESITAAIDDGDIELAQDAVDRSRRAEPELRGGPAPAAIDELLTDREREVLSFMVRGLGNAAIAERLVIKEGTVKSHVKHILRKLGAANRAEVIALSMGVTSNR